jgi:hypothetical protein
VSSDGCREEAADLLYYCTFCTTVRLCIRTTTGRRGRVPIGPSPGAHLLRYVLPVRGRAPPMESSRGVVDPRRRRRPTSSFYSALPLIRFERYRTRRAQREARYGGAFSFDAVGRKPVQVGRVTGTLAFTARGFRRIPARMPPQQICNPWPRARKTLPPAAAPPPPPPGPPSKTKGGARL